MNYDGVLDPAIHAKHIAKLHLFFKVVKILGTDSIQVPTQVGLVTRVNIRRAWVDMVSPTSSVLADGQGGNNRKLREDSG